MSELDAAEVALEPLPDTVTCTMAELEAFARRLPSARISDQLDRLGTSFGELVATDAGKERYAAFRLLMRDWPERDITSLWLHSWFVEIEVTQMDPTPAAPPTASPPSAPSITASPETSTS
jgi:hypothetical protein